MLIKRNRVRATTPLEERLIKFAEQARTAASFITPGRERDELLGKARQAEALAGAVDRLGGADLYRYGS